MQPPKKFSFQFMHAGFFAALMIFISSFSIYSQQMELEISETSSLEICGKTIYLDAVWMNEGFMTADISVLDQPNSKPITAGYRKGDELIISQDDGCTYYVFSVSKSGLDGAEGRVILSKSPPVSPVQICSDTLIWYEGGRYMIDSLDWYISSIIKYSEGEFQAYIKESHNAELIRELSLKVNYMVWLGECLFQVSAMNSGTAVHMGNKWEIEEGRIVLVKVTSYFYTPGLFMKEDINKPNIKK